MNTPKSTRLVSEGTTGPADADIHAIEAEWPVIAAELAVVEAECRLASSPDALAVRAHRRAVARLDKAIREHRATTTPGTAGAAAAVPSAAVRASWRVAGRGSSSPFSAA